MEIFIFLLIFVIWFSASFFGVLAFVLWLAGYDKLLQYYAVYNTTEWDLADTSVKLGYANFKNNIQLSITEDGLFMALKYPYKLLAPQALFIPWADIKVTEISEGGKIPKITMQLGANNLELVLYEEKYFHKLWELTSYLATIERSDFSSKFEKQLV